jgi:hypothetical protein
MRLLYWARARDNFAAPPCIGHPDVVSFALAGSLRITVKLDTVPALPSPQSPGGLGPACVAITWARCDGDRIDFKCSHSVVIDATQWGDEVRLSDLEPKFTCKAFAGATVPISGRCLKGREWEPELLAVTAVWHGWCIRHETGYCRDQFDTGRRRDVKFRARRRIFWKLDLARRLENTRCLWTLLSCFWFSRPATGCVPGSRLGGGATSEMLADTEPPVRTKKPPLGTTTAFTHHSSRGCRPRLT